MTVIRKLAVREKNRLEPIERTGEYAGAEIDAVQA